MESCNVAQVCLEKTSGEVHEFGPALSQILSELLPSLAPRSGCRKCSFDTRRSHTHTRQQLKEGHEHDCETRAAEVTEPMVFGESCLPHHLDGVTQQNSPINTGIAKRSRLLNLALKSVFARYWLCIMSQFGCRATEHFPPLQQ
eukprot:4160200-Amphidinium_carterae.1